MHDFAPALRLQNPKITPAIISSAFVGRVCRVCVEGKQTRDSLSSSPNETIHPLQKVHVDLQGKYDHPSFSGAVYSLIIADDYSGMHWNLPIKHKSDASIKLKEWIALRENEQAALGGHKVGILQSDNGGEFISNEFEEYLRLKGIRHQKSVAYNQAQNGKAERGVRTTEQISTCLLAEYGLNLRYWAEAATHSMVTLACWSAPHRRGKQHGISRYELYWGRPPATSHLRPFGCPAWAHDPTSTKHAPKSLKVTYLGWGGPYGYKAHRLGREDGSAFYSRSVKFDWFKWPPRRLEHDDTRNPSEPTAADPRGKFEWDDVGGGVDEADDGVVPVEEGAPEEEA